MKKDIYTIALAMVLFFMLMVFGLFLSWRYYFAFYFQEKEGLDVSQTMDISGCPYPCTPGTLSDPSLNDLIPDGYYLVNVNTKDFNGVTTTTQKMARLPSGYNYTQPGSKTKGIYPMTNAATYSNDIQGTTTGVPTIDATATTADYLNRTQYKNNNYDVQYHASVDSVKELNDNYGISFGQFWIVDPSTGKPKLMPGSAATQPLPTYFQPGSYQFGASSYIPNYEDSVFLSRSTYMPTYTPVTNTASAMGGFCEQSKANPQLIEQTCGTIDLDKCASTSCCVLLGGSKCVAGNESGPTMKANYGDRTVVNRDVYYYQGKCYGNCG
jgi:hypothetical protein